MNGWLTSESAWCEFLQRAQAQPVIAVSVSTSGSDPFTAEITSISLATNEDEVAISASQVGGVRRLADMLAPLLTGSERVKAFHNAKPALRCLLRLGLVVERIFDSMLADQLISAGEILHEPTLAETSGRYLPPSANAATIGAESSLADSTNPFAAIRAVYELRTALIPALVQTGLVRCAQLEFECARVTAEIENAGLRLDATRLRQISEQGRQRMEQAALDFGRAFGVETNQLFGPCAPVNIGSDNQLLAFLREQGLPLERVSARALAPFMESHPGLRYVIAYRQAAIERAMEGYLAYIHPKTGRIHPTYNQLAAATGRFSCTNPSIQSFPRAPQQRACIVPAPGSVLVMADYSQIELRIAAQISGDKRMLQAFAVGADLHRLTASILMDKPAAAVTAAERQAAKAVNFGLIYSMGARSLVEYSHAQYGVDMTLTQAEMFRTRYFQAYEGIQAWHNQVRRSKPPLVRTLSGRMRKVTESGLPIALNSPVQGSGADILKRALVLLSPALRPLGAQIVAIVHDEVMVESPLIQAQAVQNAMSTLMQQAATEFLPHVPCPVEAHIGHSWADKS